MTALMFLDANLYHLATQRWGSQQLANYDLIAISMLALLLPDSLAVFVDVVLRILHRLHAVHSALSSRLQFEKEAVCSLAQLMLLSQLLLQIFYILHCLVKQMGDYKPVNHPFSCSLHSSLSPSLSISIYLSLSLSLLSSILPSSPAYKQLSVQY